ncbi:MAG: hypothetical protein RR334_03370 [Clostridia bacterium]
MAFVYPTIVYNDRAEGTYTAIIPDVDILSCGSSVEDAYLNVVDSLSAYVNISRKLGSSIAQPTSYLDSVKLNPKRIVLLATIPIGEDGKMSKVTDYKTFLSEFLD